MSLVLVKPHLLGFKNKLLKQRNRGPLIQGELLLLYVAIAIMVSVYFGVSTMLSQIAEYDDVRAVLPAKLISFSLLGFFILLLMSNVISAVGYFFGANDLPLLLSSPISTTRLYLGRLWVCVINSSWMFALFAFPAVLAYFEALDLPVMFLVSAAFVAIPFSIIPAALASAFVVLFVNIFPIHRIKEIVLLIAIALIFGFLFVQPTIPVDLSGEEQELEEAARYLMMLEDPNPYWLPSRWATELLTGYVGVPSSNEATCFLLLLAGAIGCVSLGFLTFDTLFRRGWIRASRSNRGITAAVSGPPAQAANWTVPMQPQLRALLGKEAKMFLRDTTQCVQLILLLMLTFVYMFNLKALRTITTDSIEAMGWWQAVLCLSNVALGGCVIAAVCTRFVFPSISLEGRAYWIVRAAPVALQKLLHYKFLIWLIPMACIGVILLISGAWAIQVTPQTVLVCGFVGFALAIGIVGLAVGIGSVYAVFDWDSPTQIATSFGSLVFMLLALALILMTMIPAIFMVVLGSVPGLAAQVDHENYAIAMSCAGFLVVFINLATARWAMKAGADALQRLEQ